MCCSLLMCWSFRRISCLNLMMHLLSDILEREESGCFEQDSVIFSLDVAVRIRDSHRLSIKQPFLVLLFLFLMEIFISSVAYRVVFTRFSS